ncbi:MAG: putative nucleoside-diphosphate sugar epimerase [Actinomycetia bacterium]|jgi:FlaA1/EpsC-like NDP-sugar epimerase|nr:putative nucleoside-diphosphate sugar epimerase [Actinomycetes bacterium]
MGLDRGERPPGWRQSRLWRRYVAQGMIDGAIWAAGLYIAALLRLDFDFGRVGLSHIMKLLPVLFVAQYAAGAAFGLYRGRWLFGSFEEVAGVGRSVAVTSTALFIADVSYSHRPVPVSAVIGGAMFAFLGMCGLRYAWRLVMDRRRRPRGEGRQRVIVFGAGDGGQQAIRAMLRDPNSPYIPVAILDDARDRKNLSIQGVRVVGDRTALAGAVMRFHADALLVAVPSADASLVRELIDLALPVGLEVRVLPSVQELLGNDVRIVDIREPNEADLLGRHQVETNVGEIAQYLANKRVAVTGAGGSIGSELCRQIAAFGPAELVMIDRDESALHGVQLSLEGRALLDSDQLVLLDIRDRQKLARIFLERRPEVVFHAAALKHLPLLERYPGEALKTNVLGTLAVLDAAVAAGVETFVNISTDKAANPCSVLGYSKRIAEGLTAYMSEEGCGNYLSVRFGNVLGSRGSVLTTFRSQIESGGPLTVTHPDVTRFFMTVEEAVQLVIQAGAIGRPGEVLVLQMGDPVRIAEVAQRLASMSPQPVTIEYTGLRPGEKLHEELFGDGEVAHPSEHPLINAVLAPSLDARLVRDLDLSQAPAQFVAMLEDLSIVMNLEQVSMNEQVPEGGSFSVSA